MSTVLMVDDEASSRYALSRALSKHGYVVLKAVEASRVMAENRRLKAELARLTSSGELIGESKTMRAVFDRIEKVAATKVPALIRGASGTGKELLARELHRSQAPLPR